MADTDKPTYPRNPSSRLNAQVGMALAFWAYPQADTRKANDLAR